VKPMDKRMAFLLGISLVVATVALAGCTSPQESRDGTGDNGGLNTGDGNNTTGNNTTDTNMTGTGGNMSGTGSGAGSGSGA